MFQNPSRRWKIPLRWGLLGALLCGSIGAGYGTWLYYSPEHREAYIRETLSHPHMDSPRYVAGIVAWRYRTLGSLIQQYALGGALAGLAIGLLAGRFREEIQHPHKDSQFTLPEHLAIIALTIFLCTLLLPSNRGLVYYEGKDQFHWLMQLEFGEESQKREAVAASVKLLENPPFPCRGTIIPALAESGPLAEPAIPILTELCADEEAPVREAAKKALVEIQQSLKAASPTTNRPD